MKLQVSQKMLDYDGTEVKENVMAEDGKTVKDTKVMTIGMYAIRALNQVEQSDKAEDKVKRFKTSMTIQAAMLNGGIAELTIEEAADIKALVGKFYGPLVVGRLHAAIESPEA